MPLTPTSCPVCQPHARELQRFVDRPPCEWSVSDAVARMREAVRDLRESRCGVPPDRLLLPVLRRLQLRDDLDELTRANLGTWLTSFGGRLPSR